MIASRAAAAVRLVNRPLSVPMVFLVVVRCFLVRALCAIRAISPVTSSRPGNWVDCGKHCTSTSSTTLVVCVCMPVSLVRTSNKESSAHPTSKMRLYCIDTDVPTWRHWCRPRSRLAGKNCSWRTCACLVLGTLPLLQGLAFGTWDRPNSLRQRKEA